MKKLFTFLILLCTVIGAKAALSVTQSNGIVVIKTTGYGQISGESLNPYRQLLNNATSIKLEGYFNNDPDFVQLKGVIQKVEKLDLKAAHIAQGTPTYTYYYLVDEEDSEHKRKELTHDNGGWYYTEDGQRNYVADEDVRIYTASISGGQNLPGEWQNTLKELDLPEFSDYNVLGADFANNFTKLEKVNIPNNITVIGDKAFYNCQSLEDATLPKNLKVIGQWAFYKTALTELTIPGSVEIIEYMSLCEIVTLTKLIFAESTDSPDHHMIMKEYSTFNLANLSHIFIESTSAIDCENKAFDFRITWGQANVNAPFCTLHFSSSVAEHYANLSHPLTQQIAQDPVRFHGWLHDHYSAASQAGGNGWWEFINNGTTDEKDKIEGEKFLRTYSDYNYDRIVPAGVKAYAVTNITSNGDNTFSVDLLQLLVIPKRTGVILYGVSNSEDKNGNPVLSMSLCEIANGLPLRRDYWYALEGNNDNHLKNYLWPTCVSLDEKEYVDELYNYYHLDKNGNVLKDNDGNYLIDINKTRSVLAENTGKFTVNPWDDVKEGTFDNILLPTNPNSIIASDDNSKYDASKLNGFYRNFYLNYYSTTDPGNGKTPEDQDFMGFFRAKRNSKIDTNHAFLRVRSDEYSDSEGMEVIVNPDTKRFTAGQNTYSFASYQVEYKKGEGTPLSPSESGYWKVPGGDPDMQWDKPSNWGARPEGFQILTKYIGEPIIEGEDGHATMIIGPVQDNNPKDPYFYTIQGVRIAKPTAPGIYIHNGKKVVIK